MQSEKAAAFQKLRAFNSELKLQDYADEKNKKLICALDRGDLAYAVRALWNRMVRG